MWMLLLALSVTQTGPALHEDFDAWGEAPPAGWRPTGDCSISDQGRLGGKCIAVTGNGQDDCAWRADLALRPGRCYRVSFWARTDGAGGCATSGPESVNHDFTLSSDWERYSSVCRIPDDAGPTTPLRLGQWYVRGTCWFDDVEVLEVEPVACTPSGLGEGESVTGDRYRFSAPYGSEGGNAARPLLEARAVYNTNRWWLRPGSAVTYGHEIPGEANQASASLTITVGYYEAGEVIAQASADGTTWRELGRLGDVGSATWTLPPELFPARRVLVRLVGGEGASLQVHAYTYEARLDRALETSEGRTVYLALEKQTPELEVRLLDLLPSGVRISLTNRGAAAADWTVRAGLGDSGASETTVRAEPGQAAEATLPLHAARAGLQEMSLEVARGGEVAYRATTALPISVLSLSDYGETLPSEGPLQLWWCDATRKVAQDRPAPTRRAPDGVRIEAAGGEYEPFQLVLATTEALSGPVTVEVTDLVGPGGARVAAANTTVEEVGYVDVKTPTDSTGCRGLWPDPLPPVKGPLTVTPGRNLPLWIRVFIPKGTPAGDYKGEVRLTPRDGRASRVPVTVRAFGFDLPEPPHVIATFGLDLWAIQRYHNLSTPEEVEAVWDLYMRNFAEHRIAPYDPMGLHPYQLRFAGRTWSGLTADREQPFEGAVCAKIVDDNAAAAIALTTDNALPVDRTRPLVLRWQARAAVEGQKLQVTIGSCDAEGRWMSGRNIDVPFDGGTGWRAGEVLLEAGRLPEGAAAVTLAFRPALWSEAGEGTGTMWLDDVFLGEPGGPNLLADPGFEAAASVPRAEMDWTDFDKAGERYLDKLGMPVFGIGIRGLGSGTFYSRTPGEIAGYPAGSPEYRQVMDDYLGQIERHLREKGWLEKAYVYWFDEPDPKDYEFVRAGMETIRHGAPGLRRMLTEQPEPELEGAVDIWCPISPAFDLARAKERVAKGETFWWYVCTGPKAPWCALFIDHPATDLRVWLWQTFGNGITGTLVWATNYWTSPGAYPDTPQNPWADPMSYVSGYGTQPGQIGYWGNGDGRFLYPPNRDAADTTTKFLEGPVNSIRWEMLREGIEDYEYLALLRDLVAEARQANVEEAVLAPIEALLAVPPSISESATRFTVDSAPIYAHRTKVAEGIEQLRARLGRG